MKIQLGKYAVDVRAEGTHAGGFNGYALLRWEDGNATMEQKITFKPVFQLMSEAEDHAMEQIQLKFQRGEL